MQIFSLCYFNSKSCHYATFIYCIIIMHQIIRMYKIYIVRFWGGRLHVHLNYTHDKAYEKMYDVLLQVLVVYGK